MKVDSFEGWLQESNLSIKDFERDLRITADPNNGSIYLDNPAYAYLQTTAKNILVSTGTRNYYLKDLDMVTPDEQVKGRFKALLNFIKLTIDWKLCEDSILWGYHSERFSIFVSSLTIDEISRFKYKDAPVILESSFEMDGELEKSFNLDCI